MNLLEKLKFNFKKKSFELLKPQLIISGKIFVEDKLKKEFMCESLNRNFLLSIYRHFNDNNSNFASSEGSFARDGILDVTGALNNISSPTMAMDANTGVITSGMVFGTGTTAPDPTDYAVETPVTNGTSAGQLTYQVQTSIQGVQHTGNTSTFILQRIGVNNSGGGIDITELGLYYLYSSVQCLVLRDTFSAVTVLDTETITSQIKFSITT